MDTTTNLDAARRGDRQAQALLLRQFQDPWFRLCISLLGDPERAQDAVQETALRFVRQIGQFRGDSSISTWSMGIAINVVREMRRRRQPLSEDDEVLAQQVRSADPGPDELAALGEERAALRAILEELPQRQREAIVLRFFEDLSVEETAHAMGCAPGTVKATIHQALRSLRKRIEPMRTPT